MVAEHVQRRSVLRHGAPILPYSDRGFAQASHARAELGERGNGKRKGIDIGRASTSTENVREHGPCHWREPNIDLSVYGQ